MATRKIQSNPKNKNRGRTLTDVLNALVNDFTRVSVKRDVSEVYWRNIYKSNAALAEFTPSRIRIVEAKISLPVAIEDIGESTVQDRGITPEQIASLLSSRFPRQERNQIAVQIYARLVEEAKHYYLNKTLVNDLAEIAAKIVPSLDPARDIALEQLARIQKDFIAQPHKEQETSFLYKVADLEKVNPEHIIRLEFTLGID